MSHYVLGFAFHSDKVCLLHKKHGPHVVVGKLNGIGGKQGDDEGSAMAMSREFLEETGSRVSYYQWDHYCTFYGDWGKVRCFRTEMSDRQVESVMTGDLSTTDERVGWYDAVNLPSGVVFNLSWLIPMARDVQVVHPSRIYVELS